MKDTWGSLPLNVTWDVDFKKSIRTQVLSRISDHSFKWLLLWKIIVQSNFFFTILVAVISKKGQPHYEVTFKLTNDKNSN